MLEEVCETHGFVYACGRGLNRYQRSMYLIA